MSETEQALTFPLVRPDDPGIRPAGKPDECFYCRIKVGSPHKHDCVMVTKRVKVRYSFEIEIDVPHRWSVADLEFHRNESSWCASNALTELDKRFGDSNSGLPCPCRIFHCEHLADVDVTPVVKADR